MDPIDSNWTPSHEENNGIITKTYKLINATLHSLKAETNCPDEFIYKFVGAIQKEWHSSSCHSIARTSRKDFLNQNL
tara:strand:- start:278 stop:508 length:231 start_codon:yes stop_codon:yes gene_type:complete